MRRNLKQILLSRPKRRPGSDKKSREEKLYNRMVGTWKAQHQKNTDSNGFSDIQRVQEHMLRSLR